MSTSTPLTFSTDCTELRATREDWDAAPPELLESMLVQMSAIRIFEEAVLQLAGEGLVHGPAHSSIGQEGAAVGSVLALRGSDGVNGTHRGHHQFLAKGLAYLCPDGMSIVDGIKTDEIKDFIHKTMSEILGLKAGFSGGRGGSMHLQWLEAGALGTNAIVGGGVPLAAGNAWAQRHDAEASAEGPKDGMDVTVTYFGDGASNIGSTLETMNLAAAWRLPLCFYIENNLYAVSTHVADVTGEPRLAARGPGFGIKSWRVDGMDPLSVYLAQTAAVEYMRAGKGATLIEAETYRYFHQNGPFPGSAFGYRSKDEEKQWRDRDPLAKVSGEMIRRGLLTEEQLADLTAQITELITQTVDAITEKDPNSNKGARRIRPAFWPDPATVDAGIRSEQPLTGTELAEPPLSNAVERRFVDAIADVLDRRMATDPGVLVLGEDVHRLKGGTNGATRGLKDTYPDRVLGTPISENAFAGLAGGLSMTGRYKPVVEFMYSDFLWVAADQIFNQIGKARHMFGGHSTMPVVLRSKVAMGSGYGSQHSMDPAGIFANNPGWRIVAPSTPRDYIGLMNSALELDDPVLVLEHVDLYGVKGEIPEGDLDYQLPIGKAAVRRAGEGVTVLSYLNMVDVSLQAAEQRPDLDPEIIDLRWLDRASLDWETIGASIQKTNNVLIVEQGARGTSYGGWLADEIQRRFFDYLDQPIQRVTGKEAAPSISKVLEAAANADLNDVLAGFDEVARNLGHS
ncbi:2-oxoisovalerate dehydrogenase E1 component [Arthrobacter sp. AG367]|uniref:alpha-ketoacid dehydrogenase subunit alpha/beta n=1 Tax=Arthrobacter sp. AG367 TaxID=2572909 RepID=UPI00119F0456|nr:alpha-ketoacid dehydrogenase subunit alpha/beta [Arthrobacter sp. AG367]TWD47082.1 2-oxoisovalerate dehydrogenase E1 component [Arthrobacter sp. AG367]